LSVNSTSIPAASAKSLRMSSMSINFASCCRSPQ
jgi:hypothetical protein